jgi:hypothetical protein
MVALRQKRRISMAEELAFEMGIKGTAEGARPQGICIFLFDHNFIYIDP